MQNIIKSMLVISMCVGSVASFAADTQPGSIRLSYSLAEESNQGRAVKFLSDNLAKRTGGKMKLKGYGSASLGPEIDMPKALRNGTQEMAVVSTSVLVSLVSDLGVLDLPFVFGNEQEADAILDGPFGQALAAKLQEKDLVGLVYWENGFRNLTNSKRPVVKMEDLQGLKLRVMQNPVYIDMFKGFGTNAVPLSFSELYGALKAGEVDGQENPLNTIQSSKFYEVQKYLSLTKHVYSSWIVLASKKWWDGLSADDKKALQASAIASREYERKDSREGSAKALEFLKQKGMQVVVINDKELDRMRDTTRAATFKFANDGHVKLIKELQSDLEKLRK